MNKILFILTMLCCSNLFAATLTPNTVPYVCQGGAAPQLCDSNITTDSNGNASAPYVPNNIQVFTSSSTWVKPANVSRVYVKVWGAGGGGAGGNLDYEGDPPAAGGSGGQGGYSEGVIAVSGNVFVTIAGGGSGGSGGGSGGNGGAASATSFAGVTTIQATGGQGGTAPVDYTGYGVASGASGSGSGGSINFPYLASVYGNGGGGGNGNSGGGAGGSGLVIVYY